MTHRCKFDNRKCDKEDTYHKLYVDKIVADNINSEKACISKVRSKCIHTKSIVTDSITVKNNNEHLSKKINLGTVRSQILSQIGIGNPISTPLRNGGSLIESSRSIQTSVFELDGQIYGASCLHNQTLKRINNNVAEMVTENIDPMSIIDTETLSMISGRAATELSDCWGWTWVDEYNPSTHKTVSDYMRNKQNYMHHYAFIGTNIDTFIFDVTDPRKPIYVQTLRNNYFAVNRAWQDCKVYDVTTLLVTGNTSGLIPDKFIRLKGGKVIKILTKESNGDDYIIRVETIDTVRSGDQLDGSDYQITEATRESFLYIVYELLSALQIYDILPLSLGLKAVEKDEIFDLTSKWVTGSDVFPFSFAHNVYVNNRDGRLYICGGAVVDGIRLPILDIKTDPSRPIYVGGSSIRYFHDFVSENYSVEEQIELLGIPEDKVVTPFMSVGIGSNEIYYSVIDVTNPADTKLLSTNRLYEGAGYYHQAWFTTDKRFLIISDEAQPKTEGFNQRNPIFRLFWKDDNLRMIEQQPLKGPYRARNHNLYTRSNRRMFPEGPIPEDFDVNSYYNSQPFEDWVFCSDYTAGATLYSIKYRPGYDKTSTKEFDNPFIWERVGQLMTNPYYDEHVFANGWSIFPFGEWQVPASEMTFYQNGGQNGAMGKYRKGFFNLEAAPLLQQGNLKLLHDPSDIRPTLTTGKILGTDGSYIDVVLLFLGKDMSTDLTIFAIDPINIEDRSKLKPPKLANSLIPGEKLYSILDGRLVEANNVKHSTTYNTRNMGMILDFDGSETQYTYHYDRMSELILDIPARSGHSGSPVVNKNGELVGMIRDHDLVGGLAGAVDLTVFRQQYLNGGLQFIKPTPNGFQDLFKNFTEGVEDETKFAAIGINPRNGRIAPILLPTGSQFWLLPYKVCGDTDFNTLGDPFVWALGGRQRGPKLIKTEDGKLWTTRSFVPEWNLGFNIRISTYQVPVKITSGAVEDLLYMEEIRGSDAGGAPAIFFLSHLGKTTINGEEYELLEYTPIPTSTDQGLYTTPPNVNEVLSFPQGDKVMEAQESNVVVRVETTYIGRYTQNRSQNIAPSWVRTGPNQPGGAVPIWPFIKSTALPLFDVENMGNNAVRYVSEVPKNFEVAPIVNINSDDSLSQLKTAMLGVQLGPESFDGSVKIAKIYPMFEDQHNPSDRFQSGDIIKSVDGVPVDKDNVFALILSKLSGTDAKLIIHRHSQNHSDINITRKRFQKYNTILKLA